MNRELLRYEMMKAGFTVKMMEQELGMDHATFYRKCNGLSEFRQSEIKRICEILKIEDPRPIFFAN